MSISRFQQTYGIPFKEYLKLSEEEQDAVRLGKLPMDIPLLMRTGLASENEELRATAKKVLARMVELWSEKG